MNLKDERLQPITALSHISYDSKEIKYFAGARCDYVAELPCDANARILEIGCGNGDTGALAISEGKCACYCGVEVYGPAAEIARSKITEVIAGDVENTTLSWPSQSFDALILSEVLEHLVDPWTTLRKLRPLMKPGALVFASSPNISHYSVISMLLRGEWHLANNGIMDRSHLRWFTPKVYRAMFESSGYHVTSLRSLSNLGMKARVARALLCGFGEHLLWRQIDLRATCFGDAPL